MKHLLALSFCLVFAMNSKSQDYIPFPLENTRWFNGFYECDDEYDNCLFYGPFEFYTDGDTLINGQSMTRIMSGETSSSLCYGCEESPTPYVGALREDSGQVYLVPWFQEQEIILFDFTLNIGDQIQFFSVGDDMEVNFSVEDVTYENFNGITRKVIYFQSFEWIEGIGCDRGIFWELGPNLSGYYNLQECVQINGEIVFDHEYGEYNCSLVSVEDHDWEISIYPNPNNGQFKIEGLNGEATVELLDYSGRKIGQSQFLSESGEVDFKDALPVRGFYFVRITNADSVRMVRVVID